MGWFATVGGGEEVQGGLRQTGGTEEVAEGGTAGTDTSKLCPCFFKEGTSPAMGSTQVPFAMVKCKGTLVSPGCRRRCVD